MPKINIPIGTNGELDYTDESRYLDTLIYKIDRTNSGQSEYTSLTSRITYRTEDYPEDNDIYNCGEIGMIRLLQKLYGGEDGFLLLANDYNRLELKKKEITLASSNWKETEIPDSNKQTISDEDITSKSSIDLSASYEEYYNHINDTYTTFIVGGIYEKMADIYCISSEKPNKDYNIILNIRG